MGRRGPAPRHNSARYDSRAHRPPKTLADLPASALGVAKMPAWLDREARAFWRKHAPGLVERGHLTAMDETMFAVLCQTWADLRKYDAILAEEGEVITGPRGGVRQHPLVSVRARTLRSFVEGSKDFGLTPQSRERLPIPPPQRKPDDFMAWVENKPGRPWTPPADDPRDVLRADSQEEPA